MLEEPSEAESEVTMKNPNIARMLKYYRKSKKLSVKQVSDIFSQHGNKVAAKTIYGWESGQTQPSADDLMFLCELYEIDNILEIFGYTGTPNEPFHVSDYEKLLISSYREHPELQPAVRKLLDLEPEAR